MDQNFALPRFPSFYEMQSKHFMEAVRDVRMTMEPKTQPDQVIAVSYSNGIEEISVGHILVYTETAMAVLTGIDGAGNPTNVIGHVNSIRLTWRIVKKDDGKEKHIGFTGVSVKKEEAL
jgi:hypothetical protein